MVHARLPFGPEALDPAGGDVPPFPAKGIRPGDRQKPGFPVPSPAVGLMYQVSTIKNGVFCGFWEIGEGGSENRDQPPGRAAEGR